MQQIGKTINGRTTICSKHLSQNLIIILAAKNKQGTVGTSFHGVKNNILSPDPESGEGEIIVSSRAVFMGYVKVRKKSHEYSAPKKTYRLF